MEKVKRWEIAVCERGTVHIHYGSGSLHVLTEDFEGLAKDLLKVAEMLGIFSSPEEEQLH